MRAMAKWRRSSAGMGASSAPKLGSIKPVDGRLTRGGPGNLWGGPGVVPKGQRHGGDEDATLSKGGSDDARGSTGI